MRVSEGDRRVVEALFRAMQAGPEGEDEMVGLFAPDGVFVEPFAGEPRTHVGLAAIREAFRDSTREPLPDMRLTLDRVDAEAGRVRAEWTCTSPVFPAPMRGVDHFTIRDGRIARLEIEVTEAPGHEDEEVSP